jgi:hypothetical protein
VAGDPEFIRQQSAEQLALLHGTIADRTLRLLEAYWRAQVAGKG